MFSRKFIKPVADRLIRPLILRYTASERGYRYGDIRIRVKPGVFHPGFFFSTKVLLKYLKKLDLDEQRFLEIGAGSGLVSLFAAKRGAIVTATDISEIAFANIAENALRNSVEIAVIHSDLFENLPHQTFDVIVVNPPFFPKNPQNEAQFAWYCGKNHDYFHRFFAQLPTFISPETTVMLILSDVCDIAEIQQIARENGLAMTTVFRKKVWWETNTIFRIEKSGALR